MVSAAGVVTRLFRYPVKSLPGLEINTQKLSALGPEGDRRWMVCGEDGHFVTLRELPGMCRILVAEIEEGLRLMAPGQPPISVMFPDTKTPSPVQVWGDAIEALDAGDKAAEYLSAALGRALRLVYMPDDCHRPVDPAFARSEQEAAARVSFADGFPLLLINEASVTDLQLRLTQSFDVIRFRPNIVIRGSEAFAEDGWRRIRIGSQEFSVAKPCSRCVIPSLNPLTAEREAEVNEALFAYRRDLGLGKKEIYFGQNLIALGEGEIKTGDQLIVLS